MVSKLNLDRDRIDGGRDLAVGIVRPVYKYIQLHSTTAIERATLRLLGINDPKETPTRQRYPLVNQVVERVDKHKLALGISFWMGLAKLHHPDLGLVDIANKVAAGEINLNTLPEAPADRVKQTLFEEARQALQTIERVRRYRDKRREWRPWSQDSLKCLMVSTGNIHEDIAQAKQAAYAGADMIAIVRASAQSLLDYVPWGATTEGYAGTYATQENFRLMREALDDVGKDVKRYVRMGITISGLCMPELSVLGTVEGIDFLEGDAMYGILFRDINMKRAFVDQYFARLVMAKAGVTLTTAEENYLSHLDALEASPQMLASHFVNECFALAAGVREDKMGFSHAFAMDPSREDSLLYEIAMAQLVRDVFQKSLAQFMPPTVHKSGDLFFSTVLDTLFALVGSFTKQSILYLGLASEAVRNPHLQDRQSAVKSANYILNATRSLNPDLILRANGVIMRRARTILDNAIKFLSKVKDLGLMNAIEKGMFAESIREKNDGRGLEGVFQKARIYTNPVLDLLEKKNAFL